MLMTKIAGYGSISQRHGSADLDPDPHSNIIDPEHCLFYFIILFTSLLIWPFQSADLRGQRQPEEDLQLAGHEEQCPDQPATHVQGSVMRPRQV